MFLLKSEGGPDDARREGRFGHNQRAQDGIEFPKLLHDRLFSAGAYADVIGDDQYSPATLAMRFRGGP
jgi:hypothetical protein